MGAALSVTVLSIAFTWFCCLATASTNQSVLNLTAWGISYSRFDASPQGSDGSASSQMVGQITYVGLRQLVLLTCTDAPDNKWTRWGDCTIEVTKSKSVSFPSSYCFAAAGDVNRCP